jgi:hypothetical protein
MGVNSVDEDEGDSEEQAAGVYGACLFKAGSLAWIGIED